MQLVAILLIFLMASAGPGPALAQTSSGSKAPAATAPGLQHNVGTLAEMMREIHCVLHLGSLTPKEAGQLSEMMIRLGIMMKEMSGPQAEQYQSLHQRQLEEMKTQLAEIKARLESRRK